MAVQSAFENVKLVQPISLMLDLAPRAGRGRAERGL